MTFDTLDSRMSRDGSGVKSHAQTLARPLGMPYDANAPVHGLAARAPRQPMAGPLVSRFIIGLLQHRSTQGFLDRRLHGVKLVAAGHLLDY